MEAVEPREPRPLTGYHQVLILLFSYYFLGGGAVPLSEQVEEVVPEGPRQERALAIAGELEGVPEAMREEVLAQVGGFYDALASPEVSAEALGAATDGILDSLHAANLRALDLRMRLADELTAEEWRELFEGIEPEERAYLP